MTPTDRDRSERNAAQLGTAHLRRLSDIDDFQVADGYADIRGWNVATRDGWKIGTVDELIVDTAAMRVRYLDVELDRATAQRSGAVARRDDQATHTLVPIGLVEVDEQHDEVFVEGYTVDEVLALPRYDGRTISTDYETAWRTRHALRGAAGAAPTAPTAARVVHDDANGAYSRTEYDDQRAYARRRAAAARPVPPVAAVPPVAPAPRVPPAAVVPPAPVAPATPAAPAAPVTPVAPVATTSASGVTETADEVRIPIMEERLVVQKVLVPREEIIVRKKRVAETQTVEADVRRERLDVDGLDRQGKTKG